MDNSALISIIVPVYNVEEFLEECVQSILLQTYKNIEVILVNDGSTDGSKQVCNRLMEADSRVSYFEKENSGLSDTRNVGLDHARGEYIMFVDSDDLIPSDAVSELMALCVKYDTPMAVGKIAHFSDRALLRYRGRSAEKTFNREEALRDFLYQKEISTSACGKLYSASLLKNIRFKSGLRYEDNLFLSDVMDCVEKVAFFDGECYGYRHRINSITTNSFSSKDLDILAIGKELIRRYEKKNIELSLAVHTYQITNCLRIYLTMSDVQKYKHELEYCKDYIRKYKFEVLQNKNVRFKLKVGLLMTSLPRKVAIYARNLKGRWKN